MKKYKSNKKIIKGRWYNINKKIKKKLTAKYHKIKDWRMDPKGYFLIAVNKRKKNIQVGYCKFTRLGNTPLNDMVAIIEGKTAIEIVNTLISLDHVIDVHDMRTRSAGVHSFIQLHIELKGELTLVRAHVIADEVENLIRASFPNTDIIIHQDPAGLEEWQPNFAN